MMGNAQQRSTQRSGLGPSEYLFEPRLRHPPQTQALSILRLALGSQRDAALSTIHYTLAQDDECLALEGSQIVAERRTIDRQSIGELSKCRWFRRPMRKLGQDCKLGRPQAAGFERCIIKLCQPSGCLAQRRGVAWNEPKI